MIILLLVGVGVVMVYSASAIYAYEHFDDTMFFFKRHCGALVIGIVLAIGVMMIDLARIQRAARPLVIIAIVFLLVLLIPGLAHEVGGARRWVRFGPINFQPSEFAKLALIIYLADCLTRKGARINEFVRGFIPPVLVLGLMLGLIVMQPDLGRAVELVMVAGILFFVSGFDLRYIGLSVLGGLPALYWLVWSVPYRRQRIFSFLDPWSDARGTGFQIVQSYLAFGSGGLFGVGLGASIQKLFYLPEAHTDFIFSIIGEELGFLGTFSVCALFVLFFVHGFFITIRCGDRFSSFLVFGITLMITIEALINIGVTTGLLPTKGLPLPFISYGGSALVIDLIAIGLMLNASRGAEQVL